MNVEILSIGTELLLGEIVDTNSAYIARALRDIGVNVYFMATVGDNLERIEENLLTGLARSDVVITTGGLGPTVDDITRQAVAAAMGTELVFHQELLDQIAERFRNFGSRMSENNRLQAYIPDGAQIIENPVGTAPCYIAESEQGSVISLPGVPAEMKYLMEHSVLPYLREKIGNKIIKALVLKTAGIGESHLDEHIADLMKRSNPTVGLAAHTGQTDIRITVRADSEEEADKLIAEMEAEVRARVGDFIYATGKTPLQNALVTMLQKHSQFLAISETGTHQALAHRLKAVPGGGAVLKQSIHHTDTIELAKQNPAAEEGLDNLVQSEAERILNLTGADIAIAIATHDEGTAIAVTSPSKKRSRIYNFGGVETRAPEWAGTWGMSLAWRICKELELEAES